MIKIAKYSPFKLSPIQEEYKGISSGDYESSINPFFRRIMRNEYGLTIVD